MARTKQDPLNRHIGAKLGGLNSTTKSQLKKLEKIKIKKTLPQVPLCNFYIRYKGKWIDKGLSCRLCGVLLPDEKILEKHRYICKINKDKHIHTEQ